MTKTLQLFSLLALLLLASCASVEEPADNMVPPNAKRQGELTRLFDRMGAESESVGVAAASEAASGDDRDLRFMASLWGTRPKSAVSAKRFGEALSKNGEHEFAFDWFERAFMHLPADDEMLPYLRYDMANEYYMLGRYDDAVNLLANRLSTTPLPKALKPKYDALMKKASAS